MDYHTLMALMFLGAGVVMYVIGSVSGWLDERKPKKMKGSDLDKFLDDLIGEPTTSGDLVRSSREKFRLSFYDVYLTTGILVSVQESLENDSEPMTWKYANIYAAFYGTNAEFFLFPDGYPGMIK